MTLAVVLFGLKEPAKEQQLISQLGEIRTIRLNDGSEVHLNTDSQVNVEYSRDQRKLTLVRGEAFFDVAHNPQRPFLVVTERATFTALGTAFNVYTQRQQVELQVTDGVVKAQQNADASTPHPESKTLSKNQRIALTGAGFGQVNNNIQQLSWHSGQLHFQQKPLAEAIAELNRYLDQPVSVIPTLAKRSVSGIYQLSDPEQALALLLASEGLTIHRTADGQRQLSEPL